MARKIIYLLLIVLIFLTGCKKEEEKEYTSMDVAGAIAALWQLNPLILIIILSKYL